MRLVSILHRLYPQKGFVYGKPILAEHAGQQAIRVPLRSRKGSRPICAGCGKRGPGYDQLAEVVSVCAALGVGGVFYVPHAAGGLPALRRDRGARALGAWQGAVDRGVHVVSDVLVEAAGLAARGRGLSGVVGDRVRRRRACGRMGPGPPAPRRNGSHRCR
jgi:hypothetical protein